MKRNFLFLLSFVMVLMTACSQDNELIGEAENSALAKVEMTYEQYLKGYTQEEVMAPKDEKTPTTTPETVADDELMKLLNDSLQNTYSKTSVSTRSGTFPEFIYYMDCEDGGWTDINGKPTEPRLPGTWVDGNGNIWMSFCLVMADNNYDFIPFHTGALYFHGGNARHIAENGKKLCHAAAHPEIPGGLEFLERAHDNEDNNNINGFNIINQQSYDYIMEDFFPDWTPRPTCIDTKNMLLTWIINKGFPIKQFNPGFSYGVLSLEKTDIKISIDDENGKNNYRMTVAQWLEGGYWRNPSWTNRGKYHDLILDQNSFYYVKIIY